MLLPLIANFAEEIGNYLQFFSALVAIIFRLTTATGNFRSHNISS